jgi:predicted transcriptional regulator
MPPLGDQERDLLRHIDAHAPITVREATATYGKNKGLARTTILTMMERLRTKGYLKREQVDGVYQYRPCVSHADVMRQLVHDFVHNSLGGNISPFVAYLAEEKGISESDLSELRRMVADMEKQEGRE